MKKYLLIMSALCSGGAFAQSCTTTISPGTNLASAVSSAAAGSTICLNSGNWGSTSLSGIVKTDYVTIRSATGVGAVVVPTITGGTQFVRLSSLTIGGAAINGANT